MLHNDDTTIKILELLGKRAQQEALAEDSAESPAKKKASERSGLFTSGIVSTREGRRIALFFSGRKHAGENLTDVLAQRAAALAPPIQMCDALSRNLPAELETIVANCLAHGRRQFVDVAERFPEECRQRPRLPMSSATLRGQSTARVQFACFSPFVTLLCHFTLPMARTRYRAGRPSAPLARFPGPILRGRGPRAAVTARVGAARMPDLHLCDGMRSATIRPDRLPKDLDPQLDNFAPKNPHVRSTKALGVVHHWPFWSCRRENPGRHHLLRGHHGE